LLGDATPDAPAPTPAAFGAAASAAAQAALQVRSATPAQAVASGRNPAADDVLEQAVRKYIDIDR